MKKYFKNTIVSICLLVLVSLPQVVGASEAYDNLVNVGSTGTQAPYKAVDASGTSANSLAGIIGLIIKALLGLLGVIFLVLIVYAGFLWMTAQGDEDKVTKAKETIQRAVIGLVITIGAYAISAWVVDQIVTKGGILS